MLDSCLDVDQGCVTDTQIINHNLNEKGVSLNLFFCVRDLKKNCDHDLTLVQGSAQNGESHAHNETTRAIVSIGAGHGNNVIKWILCHALRTLWIYMCVNLSQNL